MTASQNTRAANAAVSPNAHQTTRNDLPLKKVRWKTIAP